MRNLIILGAWLTALLVPQAGHAGWVFKDKSGSTVKLQSGRVRIDAPEGALIVNTTDSTVMVLAKPLRKYAKSSVNGACKWIRKLADVDVVEEEGIASYRDQTTVGRGSRGGFRSKGIKARSVGEGPEISGIPTRRIEIEKDGELTHELLLTDHRPIRLDVGDFNLKALFALEKCGLGWSALAEERLGTTSAVEQSRAYQRLFKEGWIVKKMVATTREVTTEAVEVRETRVSFNEFKPPSGYKEIPFKKMVQVLADLD